MLSSIFELAHPFVPKGLTRLKEQRLNAISVPVSELEKDLTPAERSITAVVRKSGPSVSFVTSVWPQMARRNRRSGKQTNQDDTVLPPGMSLGSGSGFLVAPGYLCTNFHVIERAWTIQQASGQFESTLDQIAGNLTAVLPADLINETQSCVLKSLRWEDNLPAVYVRINGATQYQKCRIVDVEPDKDLAVLKIETPNGDDDSSVSFGSSSDLLVGQTVVAIGNPFGLDNTVTTGIVSAVNREFRAGTAKSPANRPIRNCVQTDAAINPGNSGGPLLNLKGQVVGINTAIVTTSGSNAGIGFAVPSDQLRPLVERMIRDDRAKSGERPDKGWLGVSIVLQDGANSTIGANNWVVSVEPFSPASEAGIRATRILEDGLLEWGDAIVAVGGNEVINLDALQAELENRVKGEQVALTLENKEAERRVAYVTLVETPI